MDTELKPAEFQSLPFSVHMIECDCGSFQAKLIVREGITLIPR